MLLHRWKVLIIFPKARDNVFVCFKRTVIVGFFLFLAIVLCIDIMIDRG